MTSPPLWVTESGDGPTIVLVHGTLDRSAGLLKLSRRLDAGRRVVRYDRRGYGRSVHCGGPYTVEVNIADLCAIVEQQPAPVALFGHSFGGNLALAVAARRPELVTSVAVYEAPLSWRSDWSGSTGSSDEAAWQDDPEGAAEGFMRRLVGDRVWERLPAATRTQRRAEGVVMVQELIDLKRAAPWQPESIRVPVVAMYGAEGAVHHRQAMERVAAWIDGAELIEIDSAGHFGPNTRPGAVAAALMGSMSRAARLPEA